MQWKQNSKQKCDMLFLQWRREPVDDAAQDL
jgi:hypothetical protein